MEQVSGLTNSIWTFAEYTPGFSNYTTTSTPGEEDIKAYATHEHCTFSLNLFNLTASILSGGVINLGGVTDRSFDSLTVMTTLDKDAISTINYYDDGNIDHSNIQNGSYSTDTSSYVNRNKVFIPHDQLIKFLDMGFTKVEIDYFTQTEYDKYEQYGVISCSTTTKSTSSYKELKLTVSKLTNGNYFIKTNLYWKKLPSNRYFDLIGIDLPTNYTMIEYCGKQIYDDYYLYDGSYTEHQSTQKSVIKYSNTTTGYFSVNTSGIAMKHNLINNAEELLITLQVEVTLSSSSDYISKSYFTHAHDYYNISNTEFFISSNGTGIQFENSSLYDKYDGLYYTNSLYKK